MTETHVEKEQKETRFHKEAVAQIFNRRGDSDDAIPDSPFQSEDHAQTTTNNKFAGLRRDKKQTGIDSTQDINKSEKGQSENNSTTKAYSHSDKPMPSGASQLWRKHFTYYMSSSSSNSSYSKPTHTENPQTGESTCNIQTSRHCHPMCFARPSSYQTYASSRGGESSPLSKGNRSGGESRPLSKGNRSAPLSSIITERHPLGLGNDFFSDDSDSDEEAFGKVAL